MWNLSLLPIAILRCGTHLLSTLLLHLTSSGSSLMWYNLSISRSIRIDESDIKKHYRFTRKILPFDHLCTIMTKSSANSRRIHETKYLPLIKLMVFLNTYAICLNGVPAKVLQQKVLQSYFCSSTVIVRETTTVKFFTKSRTYVHQRVSGLMPMVTIVGYSNECL